MPQRHQVNYMLPIRRRKDAEKSGVANWAIIGIFLIMLFAFILQARYFLMPVTLAILLFFVFIPFRRWMERIGMAPPATAALVVAGMLVFVGVIGFAVSGPVGKMFDDAPRITQKLEQKFSDLREQLAPLQRAAEKLDELSQVAPATVQVQDNAAQADVIATPAATPAAPVGDATAGDAAAPTQINVQVDAKGDSAGTLDTILSVGPSIIGQVIFTLVLLYFLLASGDLMYLKIVQSFDTLSEKRAAYLALREIENSLGSYLGTITLINAGLGVAIGLAMWAWGMPSPILWGIIGFLFNFVPYLGAMGGTVGALVVGLVLYDDFLTPILVGLTYLALTSLEGQFVTPQMVSRRLSLNTVVVFTTVALWAWLWSILGMVVAVPMLVVMKVLCDHIPGLQKFGNFLAGEEPPALEDEDEEEARDIVEDGDQSPAPPA